MLRPFSTEEGSQHTIRYIGDYALYIEIFAPNPTDPKDFVENLNGFSVSGVVNTNGGAYFEMTMQFLYADIPFTGEISIEVTDDQYLSHNAIIHYDGESYALGEDSSLATRRILFMAAIHALEGPVKWLTSERPYARIKPKHTYEDFLKLSEELNETAPKAYYLVENSFELIFRPTPPNTHESDMYLDLNPDMSFRKRLYKRKMLELPETSSDESSNFEGTTEEDSDKEFLNQVGNDEM